MFYNMGEVLSDQFDHFKLIVSPSAHSVKKIKKTGQSGGTVHWREDNFVILFLLISVLFFLDIKYLGV